MDLFRRVTTSVADDHRLTPEHVRRRVTDRLDEQRIVLRAIDEQAAVMQVRRRGQAGR